VSWFLGVIITSHSICTLWSFYLTLFSSWFHPHSWSLDNTLFWPFATYFLGSSVHLGSSLLWQFSTFLPNCSIYSSSAFVAKIYSHQYCSLVYFSDINSPHLSVVFPHALFYHIILTWPFEDTYYLLPVHFQKYIFPLNIFLPFWPVGLIQSNC
jgi:hypothetical protein